MHKDALACRPNTTNWIFLQESKDEKMGLWRQFFKVEDVETRTGEMRGHKFGSFISTDGHAVSVKMLRLVVSPENPPSPFHITFEDKAALLLTTLSLEDYQTPHTKLHYVENKYKSELHTQHNAQCQEVRNFLSQTMISERVHNCLVANFPLFPILQQLCFRSSSYIQLAAYP